MWKEREDKSFQELFFFPRSKKQVWPDSVLSETVFHNKIILTICNYDSFC